MVEGGDECKIDKINDETKRWKVDFITHNGSPACGNSHRNGSVQFYE